MLAVLLAAAASGLPATKINGAVMSFVDPKTRSKVVLVGSMHYNPHSIGLARTTVEQEAANGRLRGVCVESCPTRWNATLEAQPVGSFLRALCDNEMQSGQEAGEAAGAEIVLADQSIEDTGRRIVQVTAQTLVELATPWRGGWNRIGDDFAQAFSQLAAGDGNCLGPDALLDPRLLLGIPLSFARYPLSIGVKSPVVLAVLALALGLPLLDADGGLAADAVLDDATAIRELLGALAFALLETVVLGRVLLVALLEERNFVLARNIRRAALAGKPGGTVVAVLGMAHCNGVGKVLRESRIV